jgi:hypothetical protein
VPEEDDGPQDAGEGDGGGAEAEGRAQPAAERRADGTGYGINGGRQDSERQEGAREEGQDGPQLILPARVDGR